MHLDYNNRLPFSVAFDSSFGDVRRNLLLSWNFVVVSFGVGKLSHSKIGFTRVILVHSRTCTQVPK